MTTPPTLQIPELLLSVDAAWSGTIGIAVWDAGHVRTLSLPNVEALPSIATELWDVNVIAIEDGFVHRNKRTALQLAEARGQIIGAARMLGPVETVKRYQPARWRRLATVPNSGDREQLKLGALMRARWLATPVEHREPPAKPGSIWRHVHLPGLAPAVQRRAFDEIEAALVGLAWLRDVGLIPLIPSVVDAGIAKTPSRRA